MGTDRVTIEAGGVIGECCTDTSHDNPGAIFCSECGRDAQREIAAALQKAELRGRELMRKETWRLICKYEADGNSNHNPRLVARDDDGTPNVYNTLRLLADEVRTLLLEVNHPSHEGSEVTGETEQQSGPKGELSGSNH